MHNYSHWSCWRQRRPAPALAGNHLKAAKGVKTLAEEAFLCVAVWVCTALQARLGNSKGVALHDEPVLQGAPPGQLGNSSKQQNNKVSATEVLRLEVALGVMLCCRPSKHRCGHTISCICSGLAPTAAELALALGRSGACWPCGLQVDLGGGSGRGWCTGVCFF